MRTSATKEFQFCKKVITYLQVSRKQQQQPKNLILQANKKLTKLNYRNARKKNAHSLSKQRRNSSAMKSVEKIAIKLSVFNAR